MRGSFGSNIYLLAGEGLVLVDGGFPMDLAALLLALRSLGAGPGDVDLVIATHYHGDHTGTMARLQKAGAEVAMHPEDASYAAGERPQETCEVALHKLLFYTALWPLFRYRHFRPDRFLRDGDRLDLLGGMEVLHAPGHSPGSLCLYAERPGILFSGDLVRNERGVLEGPPPHFTPDREAARESLRRVGELEFDLLLPGHGEVIARGAGRRYRTLVREGRIWPL
ncbi:MAG: MBL fold metallo-hydrolase [Actinobacteria bacterium]|nr:MBL fold metallo-hydrolase [Actinomycetota bacterium]MDI6831359.1 MBL fold metallo-hydrolase [Actinomycetota bacterium]